MRSKKNLKRNLITFLTIFDGKPNILAEYLLEYDLLDDNIIKLLLNNKELNNKSKELKDKGEIEKPYFTSLEEMQKFYNQFFISEKKQLYPLLGAETQEESIILQLKNAILSEDYNLAAQLRDYCQKNNIDIKKYF